MREGFETDERELNHLRKNQKSDRVLPVTNLLSDIHAVISSLGVFVLGRFWFWFWLVFPPAFPFGFVFAPRTRLFQPRCFPPPLWDFRPRLVGACVW